MYPVRPIVAAHRRALVYLGFRFDDVPDSFDGLLLETLSAGGRILQMKTFGDSGIAAVVALAEGPERQPSPPRSAECVTLQPARRW